MDSRFADRQQELGDLSDETIRVRWQSVVAVATAADVHAKARLVLLACQSPVDRATDEWFWKPFRDAEASFRIDDGVELHARLASAAACHLIERGDDLVPILVRLAMLAGASPINDDLETDAGPALAEVTATVPAVTRPAIFWTKPDQDAVRVDGGAPTATLSTLLDQVATKSQTGLTGLADQVSALARWVGELQRTVAAQQDMLEWLLGGVRSDGTSWSDLPPVATSIDAASDISKFISGVPQPAHERILAQVLAVAGVDEKPRTISTDKVATDFSPIEDQALATLAPLTSGLAKGAELSALSCYELSRRILWELIARRTWDEA